MCYMFIDINPTGTKKQCVDISNMEQVIATTSIQQSESTPLLELPASSIHILVTYTNKLI